MLSLTVKVERVISAFLLLIAFMQFLIDFSDPDTCQNFCPIIFYVLSICMFNKTLGHFNSSSNGKMPESILRLKLAVHDDVSPCKTNLVPEAR